LTEIEVVHTVSKFLGESCDCKNNRSNQCRFIKTDNDRPT